MVSGLAEAGIAGPPTSIRIMKCRN